jgi:hypothetical protein
MSILRLLPLSRIRSETGGLCSTGITQLHRSYTPIRHPHGRLHPSRDRRFRVANPSPVRTSLVAQLINTPRAATTTPVEPSDAHRARFSDDIGLPRYYGESASTTAFRGLLSVHSRCGPRSPLTSFEAFSRSASVHLLPPGPPLVLPAGARVSRVGFAPTNQPCLHKAHITTPPNAPSRSSCGTEKTACSTKTRTAPMSAMSSPASSRPVDSAASTPWITSAP